MMWVLDVVVVGTAVAAGFYLGWWLRERKRSTESLCDGCEKLEMKREDICDRMYWICVKHKDVYRSVRYCCDYKQRGGGDDKSV